jgi:phosphoesterase RecJ-like protein
MKQPKNIVREIKHEKNKRFIISSHQNLEGDAVGSQLALAELLGFLGKKVFLFSPEPVPEKYFFLPGVEMVQHKVEKIDYDVACIVDCTGLDRIGHIKNILNFKKPIINIDHHISNTNFGSINWVEPNLSCTGELIYHLFKEAAVPLDRNAALDIYVAILTDTGSFRYSNTNAETHRVVAQLIEKGLNPTYIYRKIYEEAHSSRVKLLSSVLSTLDMTDDGRIAWIKVTKEMLKRCRAEVDGTEDFVNFPRSIKGVKVAIAFREIDKNVVKVGFRSNDQLDVCRLAKLFGGGGHPSASGCLLKGSMGEIEDAVLLKAKKYVNQKLKP